MRDNIWTAEGIKFRPSYHFSPLKRPCQKSLPSSLFQREESFSAFKGGFLPLFLPLEKGSCEKIERREAKASFVARGRGKFTASKPGGRGIAVKHFPDLRGATPATAENSYKYGRESVSVSLVLIPSGPRRNQRWALVA
jgi:hypothetical protein